MKRFSIRGHESRGKEVIELLEMFGGKNVYGYSGFDISWAYIIDSDGKIDWMWLTDVFDGFTLEEFESSFPYRIGDKVKVCGNVSYITGMKWEPWIGEVLYTVEGETRGRRFCSEELDPVMSSNKQYLLDCRYMRMALIWAENSYSQRKQVGALIVKDKMIISDGYNGTPSGFENVCEDENGVTKPYVLHAEANAITKIAKTGNSSEGATLYVTMSPCIECAKIIIQSGIRRVVYLEKYRITDGLDLLARTDIEVVHLKLEE